MLCLQTAVVFTNATDSTFKLTLPLKELCQNTSSHVYCLLGCMNAYTPEMWSPGVFDDAGHDDDWERLTYAAQTYEKTTHKQTCY